MADGAGRTHLDGSPCPEGTRVVPRGFEPCCDGIALSFCPHRGAALQGGTKRGRYLRI